MYLQKSKNSAGKVYLSFVQGYRQNGKVKHKTVEKLGYLEDLEKIYDDPISHFKAIAEERNAAAAATEKKLEVNLSEIIAQESQKQSMKHSDCMIFFNTSSVLSIQSSTSTVYSVCLPTIASFFPRQ